MASKFKMLGLALMAVLALTAVMASAANAEFTSDKEHTILSGSQEGSHEFTVGSGFGSIKCTTASFAGTSSAKVTEDITIDPTYSGCTDSLGHVVDIDDNGLLYTFTTDGTVHVLNEMVLTITSSGKVICTVTIKAQTDNGITYDNLGGTSGVRTTANSTNVQSTTSGGFFNCGVSDGLHTTGSYKGNTVMTGKDTSGAAAAISVDH